MSAIVSGLPFTPMARKESTDRTQQINFRMKTATIERMERFRDRHPLRPTLTQIVEASVADWLDKQEGEQPARPRKPAK